MKLHTISTGSKGNCYVLTSSSGKSLIIEAGVPFRKVLPAIDYKPSSVEKLLISHKHGDHAKYQDEFMCNIFQHQGEFSFTPFQLVHDVDTRGYIIQNSTEEGTIVYASDTRNMPVRFKGVNHLIVECNYCEDVLQEEVMAGRTNTYLARRIRETHMSLDTLKHYLSLIASENNIQTVTLIHLSDSHSDPERMKLEVSEEIGCRTYIAQNQKEIKLQ